jgi:hypothetical protein
MNTISLPSKGGLQGGQQDKPEYDLKEVAHTQSFHLTNLQKARRLHVLKLSQKEHLRQAPARWEDHAQSTAIHCMSEKQLGTTAICYIAARLQLHSTTDICVASPFKQFILLGRIGMFEMFSLTAIPCRMHWISFDLRG